MAASPVTGERPAGFRRSSSQFASLPQRSLSFHEKVGLAKDDAAADVLYHHPSVRIYSFQPPTDALNNLDKSKKTLPDADYPIDAIEILPWRARTESLAAQGKLIIEKVQGSVHFLKAGELIHTIMKNSQCWCVDGESKFVMRIGRLRYLRIEMPTAEPEDKQKVDEFKDVVGRILKFEKTPCPFIRAFQVDLPEDAITPRRRGTWKRKESLTSISTQDEPRSIRKTKTARTMSMRGMPPSAFPSRSMTQLDLDRPRTASTPISAGRFSFPDVRTDSPTNYTSGEENTDSDRHDSESDRPDTGHSSEIDESDREINVPIIKSPLNNVQTLSSNFDRQPAPLPQIHEAKQPTVLNYKPSSTKDATTTPAGIQLTSPEPPELSLPSGEPSTRKVDISSTTTSDRSVSEIVTDPVSQHDLVQVQPYQPGEVLASSVEKDEPPVSVPPTLPDTRTREDVAVLTVESMAPSSLREDYAAPQDVSHIGTTDSPEDEVDLGRTKETDLHVHAELAGRPASDHGNLESNTTIAQIDSKLPEASDAVGRSRKDEDSASTASLDSFHTLLSDDDSSRLHRTSSGIRPFRHRREVSEMTVTAESWHDGDEASLTQVVSATEPMPELEQFNQPADDQTWPVMRTPGAFTDESEIRRRLQHRRSLSPLPPASILQTGNNASHNAPIPAVLLQKAATLAVMKPIEVVVFLVQVLARIAGGATMNDLVSGDLFRRPGVRRTASGTFDQNVRGRSVVEESEEEDDYGVPVHGRRKSSVRDGKPDLPLHQEIDDAASFASID